LFPIAKAVERSVSNPQRELYFFALSHALIAAMITALLFSPFSEVLEPPLLPKLADVVTIAYLLVSVALLVWGRNPGRQTFIVAVTACIDIIAMTLLLLALPSVRAGITMMLLFNIASAVMLLPFRAGVSVTLLACIMLILEHVLTTLGRQSRPRSMAELTMFVLTFLALGWLSYRGARHARTSHALAELRGAEVASLVEINEMIIRRMRSGVLVVDASNRITMTNEAASTLLGDYDINTAESTSLARVAPELSRRLQRWRAGADTDDDEPLQLAPEQPEVQPRFVRLLADGNTALIFLDDPTVVSRRAESMTLAALGRFSASLAHEVRNPLAAINYACQLLEESENLNPADQRLLQIIHQQCQRTNNIIESVLGLARRDRANPENLDLCQFVRHFVDDYQQTLSVETDTLEASLPKQPVIGLVDPGHLQQILTALVHNALKYGRKPEEPARVRLRVSQSGRAPQIDVIDRGPGIPERIANQLFQPFFTTSEHGTGLGLYIARELCRVNQASLRYISMPGGGACFSLILPAPNSVFTDVR
jgi:two-component system sensor histidine kinase PilS (NtrC family)